MAYPSANSWRHFAAAHGSGLRGSAAVPGRDPAAAGGHGLGACPPGSVAPPTARARPTGAWPAMAAPGGAVPRGCVPRRPGRGRPSAQTALGQGGRARPARAGGLLRPRRRVCGPGLGAQARRPGRCVHCQRGRAAPARPPSGVAVAYAWARGHGGRRGQWPRRAAPRRLGKSALAPVGAASLRRRGPC
jgi:hypothetical protein|uniref:Uncharacterized protein n=1 Tax=Zea mays TaxID=4577 RepID=A0A804QWM7_MAIZE